MMAVNEKRGGGEEFANWALSQFCQATLHTVGRYEKKLAKGIAN